MMEETISPITCMTFESVLNVELVVLLWKE